MSVFPFLRGVFHSCEGSQLALPPDNPRLYSRLFWSWLILRTVAWSAVACLTLDNPPMDTAEMLSWGREWCCGYHKHPPLPAWIAEIAVDLAGGSECGVYIA